MGIRNVVTTEARATTKAVCWSRLMTELIVINQDKKRSVAAPVVKPKKRTQVKRVFTCKVYRGYDQAKGSDTSDQRRIKRRPPVPWVQLRGYWLGQMGFPVDVELIVVATNGCITLRPKLRPK